MNLNDKVLNETIDQIRLQSNPMYIIKNGDANPNNEKINKNK